MLNTIGGNRSRHELELILKEDHPEMMIALADDLGVLHVLHPALEGNDWLGDRFALARQVHPGNVPYQLYLCLLIYKLAETEMEQFTTRLNFPKTAALAMSQTLELKHKLPMLSNMGMTASGIFQLLHSYATHAIEANMLATGSPVIKSHLQLYLSRLRYTKLFLNGDDLRRLGIPEGPGIGDLLSRLHHAKLDGVVSTKFEEEQLVRKWIS
jgi:tRNA nucleotidyltransferase (CCA-adding enzyme)